MFKRIDLSNYGPFQRAVLDLTGSGGKALNHAVVYGENGSGKTMLLDSVAFFKRTVLTLSSGRQLMSDRLRVQKGFVSFDSPGMDEDDICGLSTPLISLAGDGTMSSRFVFEVDGSEVDYRMCFGPTGMLEHEDLHCSFGGRRALAFSITSEDGKAASEFGRTVFGDAGARRTLSGLADMHWGRHSMLSIIHRELLELHAGHAGQGTDGPMRRILSWIDAVSVRTGSGQVLSGPFAVMGDGLESGRILSSEGHLLDAVESAVDDYLTGLCGSIIRAGYRRREADGWIHYQLVLQRRISGRPTEIPIERESSGIRRLLAFLPYLMSCMSGGVSVIDEMDCGVHDRLGADLLVKLLPDITGQLIMTSHNTYSMVDVKPDRIFVIRLDGEGYRLVSRVSDIAVTHRNHNNRNRYMCGVFDGIPCIGPVCLGETVREFESMLDG